MPYRQKVTGIPALSVFYNIEHSVGTGCSNVREDVMLVQYMLGAFFSGPMLGSGSSKPHSRLEVDGTCGPITIEYIRAFQHVVASQVSGEVDGRISTPTGIVGPRHGRHYSIVALNMLLARTRRALFMTLPWAPDMPPNVKTLLMRPEEPVGRFTL